MSNTPIRELKRQLSHNWNTRNDNYPWEKTRRCLHTGCRLDSEPGMVLGFAFCELHRDKAQKVLGWRKAQFFEQDDEA